MTHTHAVLEVSKSTYDEIKNKLEEAEYWHSFDRDTGVIDLHGIGLQIEPSEAVQELAVRKSRASRSNEGVVVKALWAVEGTLPPDEAVMFIIGEYYTIQFGEDTPQTGLQCVWNEKLSTEFHLIRLVPPGHPQHNHKE